ncbi:MAG: PQQ-binding-like beta-propeller repeat protein [Deltaproteobacteria bacterium]|nr:PQQ-binding-like beta-propeller repeat protein [Deltaproteobacteria bacterium]
MFTHGAELTPHKIAFWTSAGSIWVLNENTKKVLWSATDPALTAASTTAVTYAKNAPMITKDGLVIVPFTWREGTSSSNWKFYLRMTAYKLGATKQQVWTNKLTITGKKGIAPASSSVNTDEDLRYNLAASSPAQGPDGTIYIGSADGLYAFEPAKGLFKWAVNTASVVSSPAVGADGRVYFGSQDGYLRAVNPDGSIAWQVKTGQQLNSSPAIGADGTVYAMGDDGYLWAVK